MSSLIAAMDKQTSCTMKTGENGHVEHTWSTTDIQESITQLYFQLVRTKSDTQIPQAMCGVDEVAPTQLESLSVQLESILQTLMMMIDSDQSRDTYLSIMFRMLLQTRDIVSGKGEYTLSYWMILSWYKYFPALAVHALKTFVMSGDELLQPLGKVGDTPLHPLGKVGETPQPLGTDGIQSHPLGSWKDMKHMADLCKNKMGNANHELIRTCIQLINAQLRIDVVSAETEHSPISLCAKWVPREGSRYSWFFQALAEDYYTSTERLGGSVALAKASNAGETTKESRRSFASNTYTDAYKKYAYTHYRKLLAGLNRRLDTVQIKQCGNVWADIDHHKTTSITLSRNKKAFLNLTKSSNMSAQRSDRPDRIECARKFTDYIAERVSSGKEIKGGRVGMNDFTKQALALIENVYDPETLTLLPKGTVSEIELLNAQWRSSTTMSNSKSLGNMVAMVDVSSSMEGDPLHAAIALGIRVAENSVLGKRVLTFSTTPKWHNLDGKDDFVSMVASLKDAEWGGTTHFYAALKLILDALIAQKVPPKDVEGLVLAIFSDMQINVADRSYKTSMRDTIHRMYQYAGYTCPHILFWNLRSTSGFPSLSSTPNTSMMSGFSPALLNVFCEKGLEALQMATPWNMMLETLDQERYLTLDITGKDITGKDITGKDITGT